MGKKILNLKNVFFALIFISTLAHAAPDLTENPKELTREEIFPPKSGKLHPLQGKILNKRYHAPKNIFSCQAEDFGKGKYRSQDILMTNAAMVGFYSPDGHFKKAEVFFVPSMEKKVFDQKNLKDAFNHFGIWILENIDSAVGIEILKEEMIEGNMLFVAISVKKMSVLADRNGKHMSSTRGYLIFKEKDKLVLLSNQQVTFADEKHRPNAHIEKLQKEILEFRKTFEFGSIPTVTIEETNSSSIP